MTRPNLFIVGAPKCGTTSLYTWLSTHPQVFMSKHKEPDFFDIDLPAAARPSLTQYERLFRSASHQHRVVGESSTWYLSSSVAVQAIRSYSPDAKYVVCVRNPCEMAVSLFAQKRFEGREVRGTFLEAWRDCTSGTPENIRERQLGRTHYPTACALGFQVERVLSTVEQDRVLVLVLEDLKSAPLDAYRELLDFCEILDDGRRNFPVVNAAKRTRSRVLTRVIRGLAAKKKQFVGYKSLGVGRRINQWNRTPDPRPPLTAPIEAELVNFFRDDIRTLGTILDRDLSHWYSPTSKPGSSPSIESAP